ncbi:hypothetical protein T4B_8569 [Trichinella pseudospiralis]|uniref:Uncharacterized protein n=1 Tax=Trichinella pseudospiralis TaxID=6337 RepID=A0A0V1GGN3_TRIPS|nr:hypothetical protein T4B_8569 [Trichinella pseudospiralis]
MVCRRFLKSSSLTSLFSLKLFKDENLSDSEAEQHGIFIHLFI